MSIELLEQAFERPKHSTKRVVARHGLALPSAPTDEEKFLYLADAAVRRWVMLLGGIGMAITAVAIARFALSSPTLYPVFALLIVAMLYPAISATTSLRKRKINAADHMRIVENYNPAVYPSVDVFLPSAGEPLEILENTYKHVAALDYDGVVNVYVLDDSGRSEVEVMANFYGFHYKVRENRGYLKKAGNLKFGFDNSNGAYILVLDADFCPRPDMLTDMVPYFDGNESTLGILQTPQFFDTGSHMNWLQSGSGTTQEFFYRWVQPSRDRNGAPICVGTCAMYNRSALEVAGGFAQIGHSEDVHTGVKLRKAGFVTKYVAVNLAKGLCPDELDGFINQQYRWCTGSMSLLVDKSFHKVAMPLMARLSFWSGFAYYAGTALLVLLLPLPWIALMWFVNPTDHTSTFIGIIPGLVSSWLILPRVIHAKWGPEVMRVQMVYSYAHAIAIWDTMRGKTAAWVPTGAAKKGTPTGVRVRRLMSTWIAITQALTWTGLFKEVVLNSHYNLWPIIAINIIVSIIQIPVLLPLVQPRIRQARTWTAKNTLVAVGALSAVVAIGITALAITAGSAYYFLAPVAVIFG